MPNRLAQESSPYLLQHANNPVDWRPWGPEALAAAKAQDKPIFLSIGYSACHWCHVMEHESFENAEIAATMNQKFICVKVDREERPDIDHIYMAAVQAMRKQGGWPLSVFLTPDLRPFFGGTYWPDKPRGGMPGFDQVLEAVSNAWVERREEVLDQAEHFIAALTKATTPPGELTNLTTGVLSHAANGLERNFDSHYGGFGSRPKFPHPMDLQLLVRLAAGSERQEVHLEMVTLTLEQMAAGGIYDHLGGGFHRYSVDERWLVPHFEKMLYDNALLARTYVEAHQATQRADFAATARETLDYLLREMIGPEGVVHSTQDADSEGEEGKFYVWTPDEIRQVLGPEATTFCQVYDVAEGGNFEGKSILNLPKPIAAQAKLLGLDATVLAEKLAGERKRLYEARLQRIAPGLDDKGLTNWNALAIDAFALAGGVFNEPKYIAAAERAAEFILSKMTREDGRLLHAYRHGKAKFDAYLDDYVYFVNALITLYESTFESRWINEAVRLAEVVLAKFADEAGGFYFTASDHEELIVRTKEFQDGSVPSSNGMAAAALLRLGRLTGRTEFIDAAEKTLNAFAGVMADYPGATGQLLLALHAHLTACPELVFAGDRNSPELQAVVLEARRLFFPQRLIAFADPGSPHLQAISEGRTNVAQPTLFVCERFACQAPVAGVEAIRARLKELAVVIG